MTTTAPHLLIEVDGRPATEADLRLRALDTYGHFTAMQIRDGRARGMDLHLARLDGATRELFGMGLDGERVRAALRHALEGVRDASARVHVHWQNGPDAANSTGSRPRIGAGTGGNTTLMVTVRPPAALDGRAKKLMSVPYQRPVPHIKHLGGFAQIHYGRLAERAGFDDALLTGPDGLVAESAVANIGFWDGGSIVWPDAPLLTGITMALLEPLLPAAGLPSVRRRITLADLPRFRAAFLTNSHGVAPVAGIDGTVFPGEAALLKTVTELYEGVEWDRI
ncbi:MULTISPECIES: aminotransferase class IV [unclassified Streptomyces]|uniref:aminotransferase class IV n=1 Tax=unclassified Streptomyces TaxID=2593676 RepID=UPI000B89DC4A|nr:MULTISPECIES: aminotransferase class IV [unclassified Streptomyces]MYZ38572.1 class IV aminotransferase [Streptomyces sp. SID4917]